MREVDPYAVAQYRLPFDPTARIRAIPERGREELESDDPAFAGTDSARSDRSTSL